MIKQEMAETATHEEVIAKIKDYMEANGLTNTQMARQLNISRSTFSQYLNGKYTGNNDLPRKQAIDFFNLAVELPATPEKMYVETEQAQKVFTVSRFAQRKGLLALIIGPAGVGKTTALEAYTKKTSQAVMVTAYPGIPPNRLYKRLMGKLKYEKIGDDATLIEVLISSLKGKNMLLIIDEGHYMKLNLLEQLRHIQDMSGVGVVLSGNFDLHDRMKGKDMAKYAHLYSRAALKVTISGEPGRAQVKEMMEKKGLPVDRASVDFMMNKASAPGHYRIVRNIGELAVEMAEMNNEPVSHKHLLHAETLIME